MLNKSHAAALMLIILSSSVAMAQDASPKALLAQAKALFEDMEYDAVIPQAEKIIAHPKSTTHEKLDAYLLMGSSLVIVGNQVDAEIPFRSVLRISPNHSLPSNESPKILSVFNMVKQEEQAIFDQTRAMELSMLLQQMSIIGSVEQNQNGGIPLEFSYRIRDPRGMVDHFQVNYRRQGEKSYSSLALSQDNSGDWLGAVTGEWTENDDGFVMEYQLVTTDSLGEKLISMGTQGAPLNIEMAPGTVAGAVPLYEKVWFWVLTGVAVSTIAATSGYFIHERMQPQDGAALLELE
jgi:hypothetical protein